MPVIKVTDDRYGKNHPIGLNGKILRLEHDKALDVPQEFVDVLKQSGIKFDEVEGADAKGAPKATLSVADDRGVNIYAEDPETGTEQPEPKAPTKETLVTELAQDEHEVEVGRTAQAHARDTRATKNKAASGGEAKR